MIKTLALLLAVFVLFAASLFAFRPSEPCCDHEWQESGYSLSVVDNIGTTYGGWKFVEAEQCAKCLVLRAPLLEKENR